MEPPREGLGRARSRHARLATERLWPWAATVFVPSRLLSDL